MTDDEKRQRRNERAKERRATDPEYRERRNQLQRDRQKERLATDPVFREKRYTATKQWRSDNPDYLKLEVERKRLRRNTDDEYRERENERLRQRRANDPERRERVNSSRRERLLNDPAYRDKLNERDRERLAQAVAIRSAVKMLYGCMHPDCKWQGAYHPTILDFHHLEPEKKSFTISHGRRSIKQLADEINKTSVLCANCHRAVECCGWSDAECKKCSVTVEQLNCLRDAT